MENNLDILERVKNHYGIINEPYYGSTFILPNGEMLDLRKCRHHAEVEQWLIMQGLSDYPYIETGGSPTMSDLGCIRCDMIKYYIGLPKQHITREQYNTLLIWLDKLSLSTHFIEIFNFDGSISKLYSLEDYLSDDIVDKIRGYYIFGKLRENLDEARKYIYERSPIGYPVNMG